MKRIRLKVYAGLAGLLVFAGCAKEKAPVAAEGGGAPDGTEIRYAKHFSMERLEGGAKLITDFDGRRCLLVPDGTETPKVAADLMVRTPVKRAFFMSVTQAGLLDALGDESLFDSVAAVTVPADDWVIRPVAAGLRSGRIRYIAQNSAGTLDIETVAGLKPDIIFAGVMTPGGGDIFAQFDEAALPYAVVGEWLEDTNIAAFEWIKFIAAFYGREDEADAVFGRRLGRLEELAERAADIPAEGRPVVASGMVYSGVTYTQGGDSVMAGEWRKAGGRYFLPEGSGGGQLRLTMEEFFDKARSADILMYNSMIQYTPDKRALLEESPLFAEFKAFQNDRVYVLSAGYYMNVARIDDKFEEIASIFQPGLFSARGGLFYEKLPD
jgi:iron complex transport system substrate-binding protein